MVKILMAAAIVGAVAWFGLTRYTQPRDVARSAEPVRELLTNVLSRDSAQLHTGADTQPVRWAVAAARLDSAAVREWAENRGPVDVSHRGDTTVVILRRPRSTPRCSVTSFLTAALVRSSGGERLVHLSASCPSVPDQSTAPDG